jgi:hypothetical protein
MILLIRFSIDLFPIMLSPFCFLVGVRLGGLPYRLYPSAGRGTIYRGSNRHVFTLSGEGSGASVRWHCVGLRLVRLSTTPNRLSCCRVGYRPSLALLLSYNSLYTIYRPYTICNMHEISTINLYNMYIDNRVYLMLK